MTRKAKTAQRGAAMFTEGGTVPGWVTAARLVMVLAYASAVPLILGVDEGRRLFWAAAIAILPAFWVVGGYYLWRRLCPLAVLSQLGRLVGAPGARRVKGWLADNYMVAQLAIMIVALSLRLIMTNGTPWALVGFVLAATAVAAAVGFLYTGKTWCNYLCPVGMVEKIYTEPARLVETGNSQCSPCTACKKNCPDIDLEQGYWKEVGSRARKIAYYSWPGLVFGFYAYYYLVAGDWDYYFSGAWTREDGQIHAWAAPGLYFWASLPIVAAAPLTLVVSAVASYAVFAAGERIALRATGADPALTRHRGLALAGFVAFVTFYFFGGQPTLRMAPGWVGALFGAAVVVAGSAMFFRRWGRREQDFVTEKFAEKILKKWEWGDAPPSDRLQDIYVLHTERTKQREARLAAYKETLREMVADGVVTAGEVAILDGLRAQLGVSDKDHGKILGELSAEERQLFDPAYRGSAELALQREQYLRELAAVVVAAPDEAALEAIRARYGVSGDEHRAAVAKLLDREGPVVGAYRDEVAHVERLADAASAGGGESTSVALLAHLCRWRGRQRAERAMSLLAPLADAGALADAREHLCSRLDRARAAGAEALARAVGDELAAPLVAAVGRLFAGASDRALRAVLPPLVDDASPYLRAIAAHLLVRFDDPDARALVDRAAADPSALVREAATHARDVRATAASPALPGGAVATLNKSQRLETLTALQRMMFLRQVPMFADLDPDDLEQVGSIAVERQFIPGRDLCVEGERGDDVFLIVSGRVRAWTGDYAAKRVLGESGPGDCIGEMSVFDDAPRSATVSAVDPTRTLVLPGAEFKTLMLARPAIGRSIIEVLVGRLRGMIAETKMGAPP